METRAGNGSAGVGPLLLRRSPFQVVDSNRSCLVLLSCCGMCRSPFHACLGAFGLRCWATIKIASPALRLSFSCVVECTCLCRHPCPIRAEHVLAPSGRLSRGFENQPRDFVRMGDQ